MKYFVFLILIINVQSRNCDGILYSLKGFSIENKKELGDGFKKQYLNQISSIYEILDGDYSAYLYERKKIGKNQGIFVYVVRDSYGILYLLLINKNKKLLSSVEIAGTNCGGVYERNNGQVEWCGDRYSLFENDSIFNTILVNEITDGYEVDAPTYTDSLVVKYKINNKGVIQKLEERIYHNNVTK